MRVTKVASFDEAPKPVAKKITRKEFIKALPDLTIYIWKCEKCSKEVITQNAVIEYIACGTCHKVMVNQNKRGYTKEDLMKDK